MKRHSVLAAYGPWLLAAIGISTYGRMRTPPPTTEDTMSSSIKRKGSDGRTARAAAPKSQRPARGEGARHPAGETGSLSPEQFSTHGRTARTS